MGRDLDKLQGEAQELLNSKYVRGSELIVNDLPRILGQYESALKDLLKAMGLFDELKKLKTEIKEALKS